MARVATTPPIEPRFRSLDWATEQIAGRTVHVFCAVLARLRFRFALDQKQATALGMLVLRGLRRRSEGRACRPDGLPERWRDRRRRVPVPDYAP